MALRAFLVALKLPQYEEVMLGTGFGDTSLFVTFDQEDLQTMREVLLTAGVPPGHVERITLTVAACQDKELRNKKGSSPLKFNYNKQMPLLEALRDEVRALKEELRAVRSAASERELVLLEEHEKWKESSKLDKDMLHEKKVCFSDERGSTAVLLTELLVSVRLAVWRRMCSSPSRSSSQPRSRREKRRSRRRQRRRQRRRRSASSA